MSESSYSDIVDHLQEAHDSLLGHSYDRSIFLSAMGEIQRLREYAIPGSQNMDARFSWLEDKAADMGYVLVPETEHPDSPHALRTSLQPASPTAGDDCACGGGDISGHDTMCPEQPATPTAGEPAAWMRTWPNGDITVSKFKPQKLKDHPLTPLYPATGGDAVAGDVQAARASMLVTDDLVDRALTENVDLIQGYSYEDYHCIRDFRQDGSGVEIWRCPRSPDAANHGLFQKRLAHEKLKAQLIAALPNGVAQPSCEMAAYRIEHDGFEGVEIGSYATLEGKKGVVLQQVGTRVVHVYGRKWLSPIPSTDRGGK